MATHTTWDPRSAMAEEAVEAMEGRVALADREEPRQIMVLSCGHWEWWNIGETSETNGQEMAWCFRDRENVRLLKVVNL